MSHSPHTTIDEKEIAKFTAMADEWWDEEGKFKPLHLFNPVRIKYIRDTIIEHLSINNSSSLAGVSLLDVGCGGGLLAEPMARMGAEVTAIDASEKNIKIASLHAQQQQLNIKYHCCSAEKLVNENKQFDVVLCMEVVEHVADVELLVEALSELVKPGGLLLMATLNRTAKSYALAIIGAEYVLRWLPRGTHEWKKFLQPSELVSLFRKNAVKTEHIQGVSFSPLTWQWSLSKDTSVNYMITATKPTL